MSSSFGDGDESSYGSNCGSDYEYDASSDGGEFYHPEEVHEGRSLFNQEPVPCPICREDRVEEGLAITLPSCGHSFCVECFASYLEAEVGRGNADGITCPFVGDGGLGAQCRAPVESDEVLREIMPRESYDRVVRLGDAAFVRKNADYHHCPVPDCTNIVLCKSVGEDGGEGGGGGGARICDCFKCGNTSCLACGAIPFHAGRTCNEHRAEEERRKELERERLEALRRLHIYGCARPELDRSRADEEAKYDFEIVGREEVDGGEAGSAENDDDALAGVKRCRRCGNGVELREGCLKMKCLCGYRFCYKCGSENAQCDCTPSHHGFTDNRTGRGDFYGLQGDRKSVV